MQGIGHRFGATEALRDVTLSVEPGRIHAVLGENGAGKTTLMRIAYGMVRPAAGQILLSGNEVQFHSPRDAIRAGVGMVHQHFMLAPALTVAENIALGMSEQPGLRVRSILEENRDALAAGLDDQRRVGDLGVSAQQRVEVLRVLANRASILIFDEPSAVLAPEESRVLLEWMRCFVDGRVDRAIVLVTHKLREAFSVAHDFTVLRRGRVVLRGPTPTLTPDAVITAMIGTFARAPMASSPPGLASSRVLVRARGMSIGSARNAPRVRGATFDIRTGEIVGVAAVDGQGQRELLRALAGRLHPVGGTLEIPHQPAFIPEHRHREALVPDFSLTENLALRGASERTGLMRWQRLREECRHLLLLHEVRPSEPSLAVRSLSGGNQQRFLLARELAESPSLIVAENPTRGLDIRATHVVLDLLRRARDNGQTVVFYSTDLDEVLALSDRVFVIYAGVVREVACDAGAIGRAMLGADA